MMMMMMMMMMVVEKTQRVTELAEGKSQPSFCRGVDFNPQPLHSIKLTTLLLNNKHQRKVRAVIIATGAVS